MPEVQVVFLENRGKVHQILVPTYLGSELGSVTYRMCDCGQVPSTV